MIALTARNLGRTGLAVSPLALGTVKFGRNEGVKFPKPFDLPDQASLERLLDEASDLGINLLDTAPAYGLAEERLGTLLAARPGRFLVGSKAGEDFAAGQSQFDFSAPAITASIERSLVRLKVSCIDILLLHSDGEGEGTARFDDAFRALQDAKQAGKVRAIGFSGKTLDGGRSALALSDVLMVTLSPAQREQLPLIAEARAAGCGVMIKKALESGHLVAHDGSRLQTAFDLCLSEARADVVVVGTLSAQHLTEDVAAAGQALARA